MYGERAWSTIFLAPIFRKCRKLSKKIATGEPCEEEEEEGENRPPFSPCGCCAHVHAVSVQHPFPLGLINFREKGKEGGEKIRKGKEIKPWGQNRGGACFVSIIKIPGGRTRCFWHCVEASFLLSLDLSARRCNLRARRRDTDKCKRWAVPVERPDGSRAI